MSSKQRTKAIARVYDQGGEHVADLHTPRLYHEFAEYEAWDVELVDETALNCTDSISKEDTNDN